MTTLEIRVRCVSSFQPDLLVTLSIDNTVLQLKQEISKFHPAHPNSKDQKLIYSGRLLQDDQNLSTITQSHSSVSNTAAVPVVHLVMTSRVRLAHSTNPSQNASSSQHQRAVLSPIITAGGSSTSDASGLPFATSASGPSSNSSNSNVITPTNWYTATLPLWAQLPSSAAIPVPPPEQMPPAALEWYANAARYAASVQYWQFVTWSQWAAMAAAMNGAANAGHAGSQVGGTSAAQQPAEGEGQGRPAIGENMVLNAQGGVAVDEFGEGPADWLDIFFFFARLMILFTVVYASVSWEKWLVSFLLLFFLYVRQVGVAPLRRILGRRAPPAAEGAAAPAAPPAPAPAPPAAPARPPGAPPAAAGQQGGTPAPTNQQSPSTSASASSSTSTAPAEGQSGASGSTSASASASGQPQPQQQQEAPAPVVREPAARRFLQTGAQFILAFVGSLFPAHTLDQQPAAADAPPNNEQRNQEQRANPAPAAQ